MSQFTSEMYMKEASNGRTCSCIKCGVLMAQSYDELGNKTTNWWCGSCGLMIYKSILGEWKVMQLSKSRLE